MSSNLRDAAESTLHTVAEFVDDAVHTLQKVELPSLSLPSLPSLPGRHKSGPSLLAKAVGVLAAGALLVAVLAALKGRRSSERSGAQPGAAAAPSAGTESSAGDTATRNGASKSVKNIADHRPEAAAS